MADDRTAAGIRAEIDEERARLDEAIAKLRVDAVAAGRQAGIVLGATLAALTLRRVVRRKGR